MRLDRYRQVQSQAKNRPIHNVPSAEEGAEDTENVDEVVVSVDDGVCKTKKNKANKATDDLSFVAGVSVYHLLGDAECEYGTRPDVSDRVSDRGTAI